MSEQIDWSKAPEGATHRGAINWFKSDGEKVYTFDGAVWHPVSWEIWQLAPFAKRPSIHADEWSGEGLPPVGVVCEYNPMPNGKPKKWHKVEVVYSSEWVIVMRCLEAPSGHEGGNGVEIAMAVDSCSLEDIRHIRTTEQIAKDEREVAVDEMHKLYMEGAKHSGGLYALYDAGYRKQ